MWPSRQKKNLAFHVASFLSTLSITRAKRNLEALPRHNGRSSQEAERWSALQPRYLQDDEESWWRPTPMSLLLKKFTFRSNTASKHSRVVLMFLIWSTSASWKIRVSSANYKWFTLVAFDASINPLNKVSCTCCLHHKDKGLPNNNKQRRWTISLRRPLWARTNPFGESLIKTRKRQKHILLNPSSPFYA